jgi:hypothetical protein
MAAYEADAKKRQEFRAKAALENVGTASEPRRLTKQELDALEESTFGSRMVMPTREGQPDGISKTPFGGNEYPEGGAQRGEDGLSATLPDGTPRMSRAQLELALAQFDRVKAIPAEQREALGLGDARLYEIYKHLQMHMGVAPEQPAQPGQQAEPAMEIPADDGLRSGGTQEQWDALGQGPAAPTGRAPAPVVNIEQDRAASIAAGQRVVAKLSQMIQTAVGGPEGVRQNIEKLSAIVNALNQVGVKTAMPSVTRVTGATIGPASAVAVPPAPVGMPAPSQDDAAFQQWLATRPLADQVKFGLREQPAMRLPAGSTPYNQ